MVVRKYATLFTIALGVCVYIYHMLHSNLAGLGLYIPWAIDSYQHLDYVRRVADALRIPVPGICWECHQPPLYYMIAAYPYVLAEASELLSPALAVRLTSLCFYIGFLYFSVRLLAMTVAFRPAYYAGLCLLVFWPYGITKAAMISNDVPLYMGIAAALYYTMQWKKDYAPTSLALALLWNGIAIATKYSGVISATFTAGVLLWECYKNPVLMRQLLQKPVIICVCISLMMVTATFARTYYYYRIANVTNTPLLVPSVPHVVKYWPVPNDKWEYFILPNVGEYIQGPFISGKKIEIRYFINAVLKTSLFGLVKWNAVKTAYFVQWLSLGMLFFMVASVRSMYYRDRTYLQKLVPFSVFIAINWFALMSYRLLYPHTGNQDFRFIFPVVVAMAVLYSQILEWHHTQGHAFRLKSGVMLAGLFVCSSVVFMVLSTM